MNQFYSDPHSSYYNDILERTVKKQQIPIEVKTFASITFKFRYLLSFVPWKTFSSFLENSL